MIRRVVSVAGGVLGAAGCLFWALRPGAPLSTVPVRAAALPEASAPDEKGPQLPGDDSRSHSFRVPSGRAPALSCENARAIVAQSRTQLGYAPEPVEAKTLAEAAADWLDPYGLWSAAPDTPLAASFERMAAELLSDVEGTRHARGCGAARVLGVELVAWVGELRSVFDEAFARGSGAESASTAASAPPSRARRSRGPRARWRPRSVAA